MREALEIETAIAMEANALRAGSMDLGDLSPYTCPDCQGVLSQVRGGGVLRFRCHTGHAYSAESLLAMLTDSIEDSVWGVVRGLEERIILLRHLAAHFDQAGRSELADTTRMKADAEARRSEQMRQLAIGRVEPDRLSAVGMRSTG